MQYRIHKQTLKQLREIFCANPQDFRISIENQYLRLLDRADHLGIDLNELVIVKVSQRIDNLNVLLEGDSDHITALDSFLLSVQESNHLKYNLVLEAKDGTYIL